MKIDTDMPMPGQKAAPPNAPMYERFVCMDGPLAGRGLIVQMPASRVVGYDLYQIEGGKKVAFHADLLA